MSAESIERIPHFIGGGKVPSASSRSLPVGNPANGKILAEVPMGGAGELDGAVAAAAEAQLAWGATTVKDRVQVIFRLKSLMESRTDSLARLVTDENGKTLDESRGSILRAIECLEFASSLPQMSAGGFMEVSRGVECRTRRYPLGVTAGITPFNFPLMVPLWMAPLALASGNAFILKPSEQTPLSPMALAELFEEAGLPPGLFSVLHGDREMVEAICDHEGISAIAFVGSTAVAKAVYARGSAAGKRVRAMGGAKNHLVVTPDADPEMTAANVVASVTGCTGQRCMAASVLLAVGDCEGILELIEKRMSEVRAGDPMGPMISRAALERVTGFLERAESGGARLRLDGRKLIAPGASEGGHWIGPSIIDEAGPEHESSCTEIFGPVLTVIRCRSLEEALAIENANPYGNAAAIYTSSGKVAQVFVERASAGMIGVNIGVPVPREPFAFGGWNDSRFGDGDITGFAAIDFWTRSKKVTGKWSAEHSVNWMS